MYVCFRALVLFHIFLRRVCGVKTVVTLPAGSDIQSSRVDLLGPVQGPVVQHFRVVAKWYVQPTIHV